MIKEYIKNSLLLAVDFLQKSGVLSQESLNIAQNTLISAPKLAAHGDFCINTAMLLAKLEKKSPLDLAKIIACELAKDLKFSTIEIANPGFINIFVAPELLCDVVKLVLTQNINYGQTKLLKPINVLVEFVSANPTGGLHLGHARPAFTGDALAKVLKAAGFSVTKEFYVNDAGNQVETLARTIYKRYLELFGRSVTIEKGEYPGLYVIDIAQALKVRDGDKWLDQDESIWLENLVKFGVDYNINQIKSTLLKMGIDFDNWFFEHILHNDGSLEKIVEKYQNLNMLYEAQAARDVEKVRRADSKAATYSHLQAGGTFLKTSMFGDDEDRIIKRKDGRFVYLTADLAYHNEKFIRGFDKIINIFGADHAGHVARIKAGMSALNHDSSKLEFVLVQMVRLLRDGQEVKFSKRAGEVYGIDDLIDEIGSDAARFVFLMRSSNAQFDLDLQTLTKQNNDNPVFYVQYGHARMANILQKAFDLAIDWRLVNFDLSLQKLLSLPEEKEMLIKASELTDVVKEAAIALEPHRLIFYAQDLVKLFHSYFTKYRQEHRIISDDKNLSIARLYLVFVLKQTLHNALSFVGISAPDYMKANSDEQE